MTVANGVVAAVGHTPLIKLRRASEETGCTILGKAEFMNPGQSVKDRAGLYMILEAEKRGEIRPGGLVGEMALVENKPRSANVRASEDARLLVLSRASYAELKKAHPQVATKFQDELLLLLSTRLRQTTDKLVGR